ncbi:Ferredoxin-fold anticodon-binding domain-containing protein 1 -like protein [Trichinella pseudospiralis]|uniref:Ferredoxin-fold anticodon-binding domain-containing protein 1-like protein n=1 Tax=Trichinella pseudospiralis TaxID=6337 RepID=A0A0V1K9D4_TRIPS|nr:Ferredoxin-fold anticodon-binding domain-containing protein 1 -like protein [Trichinella pseudospiralis]
MLAYTIMQNDDPFNQLLCKRILILGDGNLTFSKALITAQAEENDCPLRLISTVYETEEQWLTRFSESTNGSIINHLRSRGVEVLFAVDGTRLQETLLPRVSAPFDCVVMNFPHTGGKTNLKHCRHLLKEIFMNLKHVLSENGKFYLSLLDGQFEIDKQRWSEAEQNSDIMFQVTMHKKDSWRVMYLAVYAGFVVDSIHDFPTKQLSGRGYVNAGFRGNAKSFHHNKVPIVVIFRRVPILTSTLTVVPRDVEQQHRQINILRPIYVHDVSFWISTADVDMELLKKAIFSFSKNMVKEVITVEIFHPDKQLFATTIRRGIPAGFCIGACLRLIWQCDEFALTREIARDFQLELRKYLENDFCHLHQCILKLR